MFIIIMIMIIMIIMIIILIIIIIIMEGSSRNSLDSTAIDTLLLGCT